MAEYWKLPTHYSSPPFGIEQWIPDDEAKQLLRERYTDESSYQKAMFYAQVTDCCFLGDEVFHFRFPHNANVSIEDTAFISFLYTVRKFEWKNDSSVLCSLLFPPRYAQYTCCDNTTDRIDAVVKCFGGKLPEIFVTDLQEYRDSEYDRHGFLQEIVYLGLHSYANVTEDNKFLQSILNVAHNLEFIVFGGDCCDERIFLDEFCSALSSHLTLLSTLRLLEVIDCGGYIVSRGIFDRLIEAYFSAPTDHPQKLHFENTKIKAFNVIHNHPRLDQRYRQFKSIALQDCKLVSTCKMNPNVISHWLGEDVSVEEKDQFGLWQFMIKDVDGSTNKKRKYSELEESA